MYPKVIILILGIFISFTIDLTSSEFNIDLIITVIKQLHHHKNVLVLTRGLQIPLQVRHKLMKQFMNQDIQVTVSQSIDTLTDSFVIGNYMHLIQDDLPKIKSGLFLLNSEKDLKLEKMNIQINQDIFLLTNGTLYESYTINNHQIFNNLSHISSNGSLESEICSLLLRRSNFHGLLLKGLGFHVDEKYTVEPNVTNEITGFLDKEEPFHKVLWYLEKHLNFTTKVYDNRALAGHSV